MQLYARGYPVRRESVFKKLKSWRFKRKLRKIAYFHRWLNLYMMGSLQWSKAKRKQFWCDFIRSPKAMEANLERLYFKILK